MKIWQSILENLIILYFVKSFRNDPKHMFVCFPLCVLCLYSTLCMRRVIFVYAEMRRMYVKIRAWSDECVTCMISLGYTRTYMCVQLCMCVRVRLCVWLYVCKCVLLVCVCVCVCKVINTQLISYHSRKYMQGI